MVIPSVVLGRLSRLSLVNPCELWLGNQLHFHDYFGAGVAKYTESASKYSYSDAIRFVGNAFHTASIGSFVVASHLQSRMENFGDRY